MLFSCMSCSPQLGSATTSNFVKGADVGWLPQMEATGYQFLDQDGIPKDGLQLLKDRGMNTVRLRVWVFHLIIKSMDIVVKKKQLQWLLGRKRWECAL